MSPDLTLLDFFLRGYTKPLTYSSPVGTEEGLTARIVEAAATIRREPDSFERTRHSLLRLCRLCTEVGGRMFGARPKYSCLAINIFFVPLLSPQEVWAWKFSATFVQWTNCVTMHSNVPLYTKYVMLSVIYLHIYFVHVSVLKGCLQGNPRFILRQ